MATTEVKNVEIQETENTTNKEGIVAKLKTAGKNLIGAVKKNWKPFAIGCGTTLAAGLAAGLFGTKVDGVSYETPQTDFDSPSAETIEVPFEEVNNE